MAKAKQKALAREKIMIERVQLGVRIEKRLAKVLKAVAELGDMSLGELLEDVTLHAFLGECTFSDAKVRGKIRELKKVYDLNYDVHASYRFSER